MVYCEKYCLTKVLLFNQSQGSVDLKLQNKCSLIFLRHNMIGSSGQSKIPDLGGKTQQRNKSRDLCHCAHYFFLHSTIQHGSFETLLLLLLLCFLWRLSDIIRGAFPLMNSSKLCRLLSALCLCVLLYLTSDTKMNWSVNEAKIASWNSLYQMDCILEQFTLDRYVK